MKKKSSIKFAYDKLQEVFSKLDFDLSSKDKLRPSSFNEIKTFKDAVKTIGLNSDWVSIIVSELEKISKASAAMFKLNIVKKALNLGQDLHLAKNPENSYLYYPFIPLLLVSGYNWFNRELRSGEMEVIGMVKSDGEEYYVFGGGAEGCGYKGFGCFGPEKSIGGGYANVGFMGCASREIAQHLSRYFGMLITKAKYCDLPDFEIIEEKYKNTL